MGPDVYPDALCQWDPHTHELRKCYSPRSCQNERRIHLSSSSGIFSSHANLNLLVGKEFGKEALKAGWEDTRKCFIREHFFTSAFESQGVIPFKFLNHIHLNFRPEDYLKIFSVGFQALGPVSDGVYNARPLQAPTIKHLELYFQHPANLDYAISHFPGFTSLTHKNVCQKVVVDWILSFTKKHIEHIPQIELQGNIKTSTKNKWDQIFKDQRVGVHHDIDTDAISATPRSLLPPLCTPSSCSKPCFSLAVDCDFGFGFED